MLTQMISLREPPKIEDHVLYCSLFIVGLCTGVISLSRLINSRKHEVDVPPEGSSGIISSYLMMYDLIANAKFTLKRAYEKYGNGTFKIPEMDRYTIIINKRELIEEIRKAPDNKASFAEAVIEDLTLHWSLGEDTFRNSYHFAAISNQLTRSLGVLFDDVRDEIKCAFDDLVPTNSGDWVPLPTLDLMRKIVCRTSNRIFVGIPLCRDPEFMELSINFSIDIMETAYKIQDTPVFLRPIVGAYLSPTARTVRQAMKLLRPVFEERFRLYAENGDDWPGKPVDMISWLIDEAPNGQTIRDLVMRMLHIQFMAIHTSAVSFTHALFHLAAEPQYIHPLREEVKQVIKEEGWTKVAMTKMWKLDSFLKESQRMNGINLVSLNRKIMSDLTLPDGTFMPAGSFLAANVAGIHHDESHYPDADKFDGFRFSKLRERSSEESAKHQMVFTSPEYLAFGLGRHACPGRFFAVNELKAMMAYLILNYEVKAEVEGVRPENVYHRSRLSPDPKAKVLFKKRVDTY